MSEKKRKKKSQCHEKKHIKISKMLHLIKGGLQWLLNISQKQEREEKKKEINNENKKVRMGEKHKRWQFFLWNILPKK